MKANKRLMVTLTLMVGAYLSGAANIMAASTKEAPEVAAQMDSYETQLSATAEAREKDPAWKASCPEVGVIQVGDSKKAGALQNFCLNTDGNILACFAARAASSKRGAADSASGIRVYSPKGELLKTLALNIKPGAICVAKDGTIFVAGDGRLLKLDQAGKVLASADSPTAKEPVVMSKEVEEMIKQSGRSTQNELKDLKTALEQRRSEVTGLAVTDNDVFMVCPSPNDFSFRVYRFDQSLANPKLVVEKLRGCCGQMDIQAYAGKLWIPHNARHLVECYDRDGKLLSKFGKSGKVKPSDFGGCCEPKNMRFLPNGDILAAESGPPTCIKRFTASGKFLGVVAVAKTDGNCVRVTVEVSADGRQYYLLDTAHDAIRIFGVKR